MGKWKKKWAKKKAIAIKKVMIPFKDKLYVGYTGDIFKIKVTK